VEKNILEFPPKKYFWRSPIIVPLPLVKTRKYAGVNKNFLPKKTFKQDMKMYLKTRLNWIMIFFYMFVCFPEFYEPTNEIHKIQILTKNQLFYQNHQKSTNMNCFQISIDQSLVWTIIYLVYAFDDHTTHFEEMMIF
jgi:hypothetical protein